MLKQLDLNVLAPEAERIPNWSNFANLRIHFDAKDEAKVMQMLKDHSISPAIWNFPLWRPIEEIKKGPGPCPQSTYDARYVHPFRSKFRNWLGQTLRRVAYLVLEGKWT